MAVSPASQDYEITLRNVEVNLDDSDVHFDEIALLVREQVGIDWKHKEYIYLDLIHIVDHDCGDFLTVEEESEAMEIINEKIKNMSWEPLKECIAEC